MNKRYPLLLSLCALFVLYGCSEKTESTETQTDTLFEKMPAESTGITFENSVQNEKDFNIFKYRNFYNGAGVAIGDINNDGLADVYLTANRQKNQLYINKGDFKFEDISVSSGTQGNRSWSTGVVMADINADGFLDIYVCNAGYVEGDDQKNELFINNGDDTFTEQAEAYGLADSGFTTHTAFFDYDRDGDLDAYILNNSFIHVSTLGYSNKRELRAKDWKIAKELLGGGDKLLRNDNGVYVDVSEEAGIYGSLIGFGLGVTIGDVNQDLLPDIYVSNDFYERDYLYINQGDGTFSEEIKDYMQHLSLSSMGADMADINNDGKPDIFVTDMLPETDQRLKETGDFESYDVYNLKTSKDFHHQYMQNTLQLNNGDGSFSEIAYYGNVARTDWSWGALLFDMDNDGYRDIFVSNGISHDLTNNDFMDFFASDIIKEMVRTGEKEEQETIIDKMPSTPIPNYAFRNTGKLSFEDEGSAWGFEEATFSNGSAYGDLDNDGDLDLIVNNFNMPLSVYQNHSEKTAHNFIKVQLQGSEKNTFAVGSIVEAYANDQIYRQELIPSRGFQSSVDYVITMGLGDMSKLDSLRVIYPNGKTELVLNPPLNKTLNLQQTNALEDYLPAVSNRQPLFTEVATDLEAHNEDPFVDFDYEGLIAKMNSKEGPAIAVADINNDGNEDVYIGGAKDQEGRLYLQNDAGKLSAANFKSEAIFEDTDALFMDIDNDGDLDLVVASGGNFQNARTGVRAYINDGKGNFGSFDVLAFAKANISSLAAYDFDDDGDLDIFAAALSNINQYGTDPMSMLLENVDGRFRDITATAAPEALQAGMITKAIWEDMDGDAIKDLVLVGEWMAPKIFKNNRKTLVPMTTNLTAQSGMWNTVHTADLNKDGRPDLILGNRGLNSLYSASAEAPMKMFVTDFDYNGTIEQITTHSLQGRDIPIHTKRELANQIASIKKKNIRFADYATKAIEDIFEKDVLDRATIKEINTFESLIAYNMGNGEFKIEALPESAQLSCICDIQTADLNNDGIEDLITTGNNFNYKPQFSRLDAGYGNIILSSEQGYSCSATEQSGFKIKGQVRDLKWLKNKSGQRFLIAGINDEQPKLFRLNE